MTRTGVNILLVGLLLAGLGGALYLLVFFLPIDIENILGQRVTSGMMRENAFDLSKLPSGVYFYRLSSGKELAV